MTMSRCSSNVLSVYGFVGFVEEGRQFASPATRMMSGAWPPPAPSEWYVWIVRPPIARIVCSKNPDSLSVSVWICTCTSSSSPASSEAWMTAGIAPQSSWIFSPIAPARTCSSSGSTA